MVNKPSQISPHEVLQSWLINTVSHLLVKNLLGKGGLLTFLPWKGGHIAEGGLFERGDLFEKRELIKDFLHFNFTKKFNEVVYGRFAHESFRLRVR